jgi:hypothetical protein
MRSGVFGGEESRRFVAAQVERTDHQRSTFEGTSRLLVDLQLHLEAGTRAGFEDETIRGSQYFFERRVCWWFPSDSCLHANMDAPE